MVKNGHSLMRMLVASCAMVATLSACGATDDGATITADEVARQEAQGSSQQEKQRKAAREQEQQEEDEAADRSTTDADLDAYVASAEKTMRQMFGGAFKKLYSDIEIVPVYPNGIEYDYTFRAAVDPVLAKPELDKQAPTLRTQTRTVVIPEMESIGFSDPTVTFTYRNPGGSVVWTRTFR